MSGAARIGDAVSHGGGAASAGGAGGGGGGGSILEGSPNVVIEHQAAARAGEDHGKCDHGHPPALVAEGSSTVFVDGHPLARLGDRVQCGSRIASSAANVIIGGGTTTVANVDSMGAASSPAIILAADPVQGTTQAATAGGGGAGGAAPPTPATTGAAGAATHGGGSAPPVTHAPRYPALQGRAESSPNRYVRAAGGYEGTPYDYRWRTDGDAADGTQGIDCSGLVSRAYGLTNADGTAMTTDQISAAMSGPLSGSFTTYPPGTTTPQAGDILMWPGHTGIAVDDQTLVHAPQTGYGVQEDFTRWIRSTAPTIYRPDPSVYPP